MRVRWPGGGGFQPVTLRVNGIELVELMRRIELPFAEAEYDRRRADGEPPEEIGARGRLAGDYLYLSAAATFLPARGLFGEPFVHGFVGRPADKSLLLQCTCGITECWFLLARITLDERHVRWSEFEQFHRPAWRYDMRPFVFDRVAYESELAPRGARGATATQ